MKHDEEEATQWGHAFRDASPRTGGCAVNLLLTTFFFVGALVRKYDGAGNEVWSRQFGTSGYDGSAGVAVDGDGNVLIKGYTEGAIAGSSAGGFDAFVRTYAP